MIALKVLFFQANTASLPGEAICLEPSSTRPTTDNGSVHKLQDSSGQSLHNSCIDIVVPT